jgi:hypothetical protein
MEKILTQQRQQQQQQQQQKQQQSQRNVQQQSAQLPLPSTQYAGLPAQPTQEPQLSRQQQAQKPLAPAQAAYGSKTIHLPEPAPAASYGNYGPHQGPAGILPDTYPNYPFAVSACGHLQHHHTRYDITSLSR